MAPHWKYWKKSMVEICILKTSALNFSNTTYLETNVTSLGKNMSSNFVNLKLALNGVPLW